MNTGQCMQTDVFYSINRFDPPPPPPPHHHHTRARVMEVYPHARCHHGITRLYYTEVCKLFLCKTNIDVNFD